MRGVISFVLFSGRDPHCRVPWRSISQGGNSARKAPRIFDLSAYLPCLLALRVTSTSSEVGGAKLPDKDREGQPIIFDSYDMTPVLFGTGKSLRNSWFYFTENELTPGAARVGNYKAVFNLRGDDASPSEASHLVVLSQAPAPRLKSNSGAWLCNKPETVALEY